MSTTAAVAEEEEVLVAPSNRVYHLKPSYGFGEHDDEDAWRGVVVGPHPPVPPPHFHPFSRGAGYPFHPPPRMTLKPLSFSSFGLDPAPRQPPRFHHEHDGFDETNTLPFPPHHPPHHGMGPLPFDETGFGDGMNTFPFPPPPPPHRPPPPPPPPHHSLFPPFAPSWPHSSYYPPPIHTTLEEDNFVHHHHEEDASIVSTTTTTTTTSFRLIPHVRCEENELCQKLSVDIAGFKPNSRDKLEVSIMEEVEEDIHHSYHHYYGGRQRQQRQQQYYLVITGCRYNKYGDVFHLKRRIAVDDSIYDTLAISANVHYDQDLLEINIPKRHPPPPPPAGGNRRRRIIPIQTPNTTDVMEEDPIMEEEEDDGIVLVETVE